MFLFIQKGLVMKVKFLKSIGIRKKGDVVEYDNDLAKKMIKMGMVEVEKKVKSKK